MPSWQDGPKEQNATSNEPRAAGKEPSAAPKEPGAAPKAASVSKDPRAAVILARSEEIRSPDLDYSADFTIGVLDQYTPQERKATYTMIVHGKDHTMILLRTPAPFFGGTLLIQEGHYWLLLPKAARPFQLSAAQVIRGDLGNGDLARTNLAGYYEPRLDGEEALDEEPCWVLELTRTRNTAAYTRIRCWITKKGFRPKKFEYYGNTGAALKVARYSDYRKGDLGLRPMKIEINSTTGTGGLTTLTFSDLRRIDASSVTFTPEGTVPFRNAAFAIRKGDATEVRVADLLAALTASKS